VDDTFKKIEMGQPVAVAAANPAPQTIKVSDLISASPSSSASASSFTKPAVAAFIAATPAKNPMTGPSVSSISTTSAVGAKSVSANTYPAQASSAGKPQHGSRGALIAAIVLAVVAIGAGGLAGFLYMQNNSLNSQLSDLNGQSTGVNSQLSALQAEIVASSTALSSQTASLTAQTQELQAELSFYAAPSGTTPGSTSTVTIGGTVSGGGKTPYVITAMYGAKIFVSNAKAAKVIAAIDPLLAHAATTATTTVAAATSSSTPSSTTPATTTTSIAVPAIAAASAQFTGVYVPGSDTITLTAVNGVSIQ
jgi:hypothetical protein